MRVLIVDSNIMRESWGASDLRRYATSVAGSTVVVRRAPQEDLPTSPRLFDRIVLSGSLTPACEDAPWVAGLEAFVRAAVAERKPILGVCYGHQLVARALGGKHLVRRGDRPEFGWARIEVTSETRLFKGLPRVFYSFESHFDEVIEPPPGARGVARSEDCPVQAYEFDSMPVFGIQFHPERDLAGAKRTIAERRRTGEPKKLLRPDEGEKLYDPKVAETLFSNFFAL